MKGLLFFLFLSTISFGQNGLGELKGTVIDENDLLVPLVRVLVFTKENTNSEIKGSAITDLDGNFRISNLSPGIYDIEFSDIVSEIDTLRLANIEIQADRITFLDNVTIKRKEFIGCYLEKWPSRTFYLDPFGGPTVITSENIRMR